MSSPIPGLHHVTAVASDAQRNLDFYTQVLGLRFVKRTVNVDDPGTYHVYFGNDAGSPGTILTFFPWPGAASGQPGAGEVTKTAFSVSLSSLPSWHQRLSGHGISVERAEKRFEEELLSFADPDGMRVEIVACASSGEVNPASAKNPFSEQIFATIPTGGACVALGWLHNRRELVSIKITSTESRQFSQAARTTKTIRRRR